MGFNSLNDVLQEQLEDLYSAETQLVKALPKMARAASTEELSEGFTEHLRQTHGHVDRQGLCIIVKLPLEGPPCHRIAEMDARMVR